MSKDASAETPLNRSVIGTAGRVFTIRRWISIVLLIISVTTLVLEVRSKLGPLWTGLQFEEMSEDGAFKGATVSEVQRHLALFPAVVIENDTSDETIYCYSWYSPLQHFRRSPSSELFLVASKDTPPRATVYYTDRETPEEHARKLAMAYRISDIVTGANDIVTGANRNRQEPQPPESPVR